MPSVLQLHRRLTEPPAIHGISGVTIRPFSGEQDIEPWLELRHRAFARSRVGVRQWTLGDFAAEVTSRWWWRPDRMWLAETVAGEEPIRLLGSVILAMRGRPAASRPAVHWLIVLPAWRRHGIGRALMSHLESAAWHEGHREVFLETHAWWEAAARFYESLGYRPVAS